MLYKNTKLKSEIVTESFNRIKKKKSNSSNKRNPVSFFLCDGSMCFLFATINKSRLSKTIATKRKEKELTHFMFFMFEYILFYLLTIDLSIFFALENRLNLIMENSNAEYCDKDVEAQRQEETVVIYYSSCTYSNKYLFLIIFSKRQERY
jgi:hypothetical protein